MLVSTCFQHSPIDVPFPAAAPRHPRLDRACRWVFECLLDRLRSNERARRRSQAETDYWNREHLWPQSYGLRGTPARTDLHNLVPVDRSVNSSRGNKWFDELVIVHHECTGCAVSREAWEPPAEAKGDVARVAFYMDVRYEGLSADGVADLTLGNAPDPTLRRFGRSGALERWHCEDPVSEEETRRHEVIARMQGNRNAFIDSPELAERVYGFDCERS